MWEMLQQIIIFLFFIRLQVFVEHALDLLRTVQFVINHLNIQDTTTMKLMTTFKESWTPIQAMITTQQRKKSQQPALPTVQSHDDLTEEPISVHVSQIDSGFKEQGVSSFPSEMSEVSEQ